MTFLPVGYYIVEPVEKPDYISLPCSKILSISSCISNLHPQLDGCFWGNSKNKQKAYQKELGLGDEAFEQMKQRVCHLMEHDGLDIGLRFSSGADAKRFYTRYLSCKQAAKVVCLAVAEAHYQAVLAEMQINRPPPPWPYRESTDRLLGYELLGFDVSAFHSYLCNGLEKEIQSLFHLEINGLGVIQNGYHLVAQFAECIQGRGEPVTWIPFALFEEMVTLPCPPDRVISTPD